MTPDNQPALPDSIPLEVRILARDIHYAIVDDGLAPAALADYNAMRQSILRVLTTDRLESLRRAEVAIPAGLCTLGVGDGSGQLFVHGTHDAIKACQALILKAEGATLGEGREFPERFACNGPEGTFWTDDANLANKLIYAAFDRGEWTVTDTHKPMACICPPDSGCTNKCDRVDRLELALRAAGFNYDQCVGNPPSATPTAQRVAAGGAYPTGSDREVLNYKGSRYTLPLYTHPAAQAEGRGVDAERREDMSPTGRLRLHAQDDGDMCVMVTEDDGTSATVEFCASGGRSPKTLQALRDLSRAMQDDNGPALTAPADVGGEP